MEHFGKYTLETVYLGTIEAQRQEIMHLWQTQGVLPDAAERLRRSHEAVVLVRNQNGALAGLSTVGLLAAANGRLFYSYRMFIRSADRVPYLMIAVTRCTCNFLRTFCHPSGHVDALVVISENPKLMLPGSRRALRSIGFTWSGSTSSGLDCWRMDLPAKDSCPAPLLP